MSGYRRPQPAFLQADPYLRKGSLYVVRDVPIFHRIACLVPQMRLEAAEQHALLRRARGLTRDSIEAEDLTQEAWLRFLVAQHKTEEPKGQGFAMRVLRNLFIDQLRVRRVKAEVEAEIAAIEAEAVPSPERILAGREALEHVRQVLETLPEKTRGIFLLHRIQGLTHAQIAKQLGLSEATVFYHVKRAALELDSLRDLL